jgi:hypothetical protein
MQIAGIAATVNGLWMDQIGRNLADSMDGMLNGKHYLIHDRDPLFTSAFLETIASVGVESVKLPPRSPRQIREFFSGRRCNLLVPRCLLHPRFEFLDLLQSRGHSFFQQAPR